MKIVLRATCVLLALSTLLWTKAYSENDDFHFLLSQAQAIAPTVDSFDQFVKEIDSPLLKSTDGVLFYCNTLIAYPGRKTNESYNIPRKTASIAAEAFSYMQEPYLRILSFPSECEEIPSDLFSTEGLSEIIEYRVADDNNVYADLDGFLINNITKTIIAYPRGKDTEVLYFPDSIKHIGKSAFAYDKNIKEIILPEELISIGDYAFEWCISLERVSFGTFLEEIGVSAFEACGALQVVALPGSLRTINPLAFAQSDRLQSVILEEGCEIIGDGAFMGCPIQEIFLPASLMFIGDDALGKIAPNIFDWPLRVHTVEGSYAESFVRSNFPETKVIFEEP